MSSKEPTIEASGDANHLKKGTFGQLFLAFAGFLVPALIFTKLAVEIRGHEWPRLDVSLLSWLHNISNQWLDGFFIFVSFIGDALLLAPVTLAGGLYLLYRKRRRQATLLLFGVGGAAVLNIILKLSFQRTRPDLWQHLVIETGYSFPSGHAMASSALAFAVIVLLWQTRWRWWTIGAGALYVVLVGLSRLYLGVHFPTDIFAGWCVSFAWVMLVKFVIDRFGTPAKEFFISRHKPEV